MSNRRNFIVTGAALALAACTSTEITNTERNLGLTHEEAIVIWNVAKNVALVAIDIAAPHFTQLVQAVIVAGDLIAQENAQNPLINTSIRLAAQSSQLLKLCAGKAYVVGEHDIKYGQRVREI